MELTADKLSTPSCSIDPELADKLNDSRLSKFPLDAVNVFALISSDVIFSDCNWAIDPDSETTDKEFTVLKLPSVEVNVLLTIFCDIIFSALIFSDSRTPMTASSEFKNAEFATTTKEELLVTTPVALISPLTSSVYSGLDVDIPRLPVEGLKESLSEVIFRSVLPIPSANIG